MKVIALTVSLALLATACGKSSSKEKEGDGGMIAAASVTDAGSPSGAAAVASAAMIDAAAPLATFPSPARAERKAERQITKANYHSELDKIEREVGP